MCIMNRCLSCKYMYIDENIARNSIMINRQSGAITRYFNHLVKCNKFDLPIGKNVLYDWETNCNSYERDENV